MDNLDWWFYAKEDTGLDWTSICGSSKKPGYEWEDIFFIKDGYYSGSSHKSTDYGYYWTSTTDAPTTAIAARVLDESADMDMDLAEIPRSYKCFIRPVWDPKM